MAERRDGRKESKKEEKKAAEHSLGAVLVDEKPSTSSSVVMGSMSSLKMSHPSEM